MADVLRTRSTLSLLAAVISAFIFILSADNCVGQGNAGPITLNVGNDTFAFHIELLGQKVQARNPSNEHDVFFMEDMLTAAGLEQDIVMLEADVGNAFALVNYDARGGRPLKMIVYNVNWLASLSRPAAGIQQELQRYWVIGHEIGHHACKHLASSGASQPQEKELEADRFAGWLLRRIVDAGTGIGINGDTSIDDLLRSLYAVVSKLPYGKTHPPPERRLAATREGWENGLPCR